MMPEMGGRRGVLAFLWQQLARFKRDSQAVGNRPRPTLSCDPAQFDRLVL